MAPFSRYTLNAAEAVGTGQDVSMMVLTDLPVVAERPVYFDYRYATSSGSYSLAEVEGIDLRSPIRYADTTGIMFHEASYTDIHGEMAGARAMFPTGGCVDNANPGARYPGWGPSSTGDPYYWVQESRGRGTFSTTAVDVGQRRDARCWRPWKGWLRA